jgi:hypothetical protein
MRRLALVAVALLAFAAFAGSIALNTGVRAEFTDCASGGSVAQTVTSGAYLLRVTDADVFICDVASAATCATGGEKFPSGTVIAYTVIGSTTRSIACRSSASTGDVILTAVR